MSRWSGVSSTPSVTMKNEFGEVVETSSRESRAEEFLRDFVDYWNAPGHGTRCRSPERCMEAAEDTQRGGRCAMMDPARVLWGIAPNSDYDERPIPSPVRACSIASAADSAS